MKAGDVVVLRDGSTREILSVDFNIMTTKVFNLEVDGNHNYFVGDCGILVHNKGPEGTRYATRILVEYSCSAMKKYMNVFCGVPAWKDSTAEDADIHFGSIPEGDTTGDWGRYDYKVGSTSFFGKDLFKSSFNFFTYNPTASGVASFEWPFWVSDTILDDIDNKISSYKGVLANWWAGCEPSCDMLSKLLKYQCFYGYPFHIGIGYLFRKNIPRLVFVFTNEYDNSMVKSYTVSGGTKVKEVVYMPSAEG